MKKILYSGFFDLFHAGHLGALKKSKEFGDYLIVHVAPDKEAKLVKGALRPVIPGSERCEIVAALGIVDEVFYSEDYLTTQEIIDLTGADVLIRNEGNTEKFENVEIVYIPRYIPKSGLDTTGIIKKIQDQKDQNSIAGVNYIIRVRDEILLQKRDDKPGIRCPGMLAIPGGGLDKGENTHECVLREIKEEIGLTIDPNNIDFLTDLTYEWGETNRFYLIDMTEKPQIMENEGKMQWHKIDSLKELAGNQEKVLPCLK